jgi:hypothetical protein
MKQMTWAAVAVVLVACGGGSETQSGSAGTTGATTGVGGASQASTGAGGSSQNSTGAGGATQGSTSTGQGGASSTVSTTSTGSTTTSGSGGSMGCGPCPANYACGSANGIPVCRNSATGIPLFSNVTVIVMENTSLSTLQDAMNNNGAPNLATMASKYATGSDYHGVAHPSLPNYIALTSGDTQGISCDCKAEMGQGSCNGATCNLVLGSCSCDKPAMNVGDQLEAAKLDWAGYGEDMGMACNLANGGNYAVRHVPFLYYDDVQGDAARCNAHVLDFTSFDPANPKPFNFIAPNLVHDMHDPSWPLAGAKNIKNGDDWIGPEVDAITGAAAFGKGGLLVVVWDEDDASGGISGSDDPIEIFVMSPYAKNGGFVSAVTANHYALLATIEDGLGLPRLGNAASATPLSDYFPAN